MRIIESAEQMEAFSTALRAEGKTIGFVPTMGALHDGHRSLVQAATDQNDFVVVSVFVNPTQFNDAKDLEKYPRTFEADRELLANAGVDVMFYPTVKEIYPNDLIPEYDLDGLDAVMEGPNRPGHFNGVVQVVTRLFDLVLPNRAYFGEKDFQQLAIIRHMTKKLGYDVEIIGCPTVREKDGLAMSSRNVRLDESTRGKAPIIFHVLDELKHSIPKIGLNRAVTKAKEKLSKSGIELEYLEVVDSISLQSAKDNSVALQACVAAWLGGVRLIDNLRVK